MAYAYAQAVVLVFTGLFWTIFSRTGPEPTHLRREQPEVTERISRALGPLLVLAGLIYFGYRVAGRWW